VSMESRTAAQTPQVTVLMSVYNGERFLRETVESILRQTFTDFEFLIINDGSTDSSRDIVRSYSDSRILLIDNPENMGLTRSLNRGLALARGRYVARLDADDRSYSTRLEKQVAFLDASPKVAVLGAQLRFIDARGKALRIALAKRAVDPVALRWHWIFDNPLAHSTALFRRDVVWEQMGGYNEQFRTSQDFELWSRVGTEHEICNLPDVLVDFRLHENSVCRHYTPVDKIKLETVYEHNIRRLLQTDDFPREFPLRWPHVSMPLIKRTGDAQEMLRMFHAIRKRFFALYPDAANNREILDHCVFVLTRCARHFVAIDRPGSFQFILEILRRSRLPLKDLGIYAVLFFLGNRSLMHLKKKLKRNSVLHLAKTGERFSSVAFLK